MMYVRVWQLKEEAVRNLFTNLQLSIKWACVIHSLTQQTTHINITFYQSCLFTCGGDQIETGMTREILYIVLCFSPRPWSGWGKNTERGRIITRVLNKQNRGAIPWLAWLLLVKLVSFYYFHLCDLSSERLFILTQPDAKKIIKQENQGKLLRKKAQKLATQVTFYIVAVSLI